MAIGTWLYIFFTDHVPLDSGDAGVDNSLQILQIPAANEPHILFAIETQGIYLNFLISNQDLITIIILERFVYDAWSIFLFENILDYTWSVPP